MRASSTTAAARRSTSVGASTRSPEPAEPAAGQLLGCVAIGLLVRAGTDTGLEPHVDDGTGRGVLEGGPQGAQELRR
jgi:hypothetical protein